MKEFNTTVKLIPENIDKVSSDLVLYLEDLHTKSSDVTKIRLNVEEILLRWMENSGEDSLVTIQSKKFLGQRRIVLSSEGKECNP